jgi:hypothetical protein
LPLQSDAAGAQPVGCGQGTDEQE